MPQTLGIQKCRLFSPKALLGSVIAVAAAAVLTIWLFRPAAVGVQITVEPYSLCRYDDNAGHLPLGAVVRVSNIGNGDVWFLGRPGAPAYVLQQFVHEKWDSMMTWDSLAWDAPLAPNQWAVLRPFESVVIVAGPVYEEAAEGRVGVGFATDRFRRAKIHWIFSPVVKIVKRGQAYFPEAKSGAQQEERVLGPWFSIEDVEAPPR